MFLSAPPVSAYSNVYESESNNTLATADVIYDQNYNYGKIDSAYEVDYWKFTYGVTGMVNIFLTNIPSGFNFNMSFCNSSGEIIAFSRRTSNADELMRVRVYAGTTYYIRVEGLTGHDYSSSYYLLRIKRYDLKQAGVFTSDTSEYGNFRPAATNSLPHLWDMGYAAQEYLHNNAINGYEFMGISEVAVFCEHGGPGKMVFRETNEISSRIYGSNSSLGTYDRSMSNLSNNQYNQTSLVIYSGCNTGVTDTQYGYGNLVDITNNKGVICVVGWLASTDIDADNFWEGKFFEACKTHCSIRAAMDIADAALAQAYPNHYNSQTSRYIAGIPDGMIIG